MPSPRAILQAATQGGVLVVTRRNLKRGKTGSSWGPSREIARIPGLQDTGDGGTIFAAPKISPDGTRVAVQAGTGRYSVPAEPVVIAGQVYKTTREVGGSRLLFILDASTGRILSRATFEGPLSYAWSASSRTLGVLAQSRDYQRSSVHVLRSGEPSRLVLPGATTFFWSGDALLTATWTKGGKPVPYGEMFQAFGSRWKGYVPTIRRHQNGRVARVDLRSAERDLGSFGLGSRVWSPSFDVGGRPIKRPEERSLLVQGVRNRFAEDPQIDADGNEIINFSSGRTLTDDFLFYGGHRYRVVHPGYKMGDGGRGRTRSWNLGRGVFAFASTDGVFGNDENRGGLAAIDVRSRRKRYWKDLALSEYADYDIFWR